MGTGGITQREHLLQVCKQTGKTPEELGFILPEPPEPPTEGLHLWHWFLELSGARTSNGFGPNPISWNEIDAFNRLNGLRLTPWEAETLRRMDMAYLAIHTENEAKKPRERP